MIIDIVSHVFYNHLDFKSKNMIDSGDSKYKLLTPQTGPNYYLHDDYHGTVPASDENPQ